MCFCLYHLPSHLFLLEIETTTKTTSYLFFFFSSNKKLSSSIPLQLLEFPPTSLSVVIDSSLSSSFSSSQQQQQPTRYTSHLSSSSVSLFSVWDEKSRNFFLQNIDGKHGLAKKRRILSFSCDYFWRRPRLKMTRQKQLFLLMTNVTETSLFRPLLLLLLYPNDVLTVLPVHRVLVCFFINYLFRVLWALFFFRATKIQNKDIPREITTLLSRLFSHIHQNNIKTSQDQMNQENLETMGC